MFLNLDLSERKTTVSELSRRARLALAVIIAFLSSLLVFAIFLGEKSGPDLAVIAASNLEKSGVENPVTAVLLNFRSYDTLLEIAVLMIVALAIVSSSESRQQHEQCYLSRDKLRFTSNAVLFGLLKWLVPLAILVGGYLLWTGAYAPGGAFQAGAVIAGAGVALALSRRHEAFLEKVTARFALSVGLLVFTLTALLYALLTGTTLQYPLEFAGKLILIVEVAATVSITSILLLLFLKLQSMVYLSEENGK